MIVETGSEMTEDEFVARYGGIYEHSPWVARDSWRRGVVSFSAASLACVFAETVDAAPMAQKLRLIRAHPDLAGRIAVAGELTTDSATEQSSAGLDHCTSDEYADFQRLNAAYTEKFGFPFVMAVRGSHRSAILKAFEQRLTHAYDHEFETAIAQIHKIARLRLETIV